MRWADLPETVRGWLVQCGDCWVARQKPGKVRIYTGIEDGREVRKSLRVYLWELSGRETHPRWKLRPSCGEEWCVRPEHCGYRKRWRYPSGRSSHSGRKSPGYRMVRIGDPKIRRDLVRGLERRGFRRSLDKQQSIRVGEYKIHERPKGAIAWREPAVGAGA